MQFLDERKHVSCHVVDLSASSGKPPITACRGASCRGAGARREKGWPGAAAVVSCGSAGAVERQRQHLLARVDVSRDGRRWTTIFLGANLNHAVLSGAALPPGSRLLVRLTLNDGFNQVRAQAIAGRRQAPSRPHRHRRHR